FFFPTLSSSDFLPFECDACHQIFCLEHRSYRSHSCQAVSQFDRTSPVCPLCNQTVFIPAGQDPNRVVDEHISAGCPPPTVPKKTQTSYPCSMKKCTQSELVPVICPDCHSNFCLAHRAPSDHKCPKLA